MSTDTRKDMLLNRLTETSVVMHKIAINYPETKERPICLVEGFDVDYYYLRVKMKCDNAEPFFVNCKGKDGVLEAHYKISRRPEYRDGKFFYFVDKDFDELISNKDIYETPCYSIENLYTSREAVKNILSKVFKLEEAIVDSILGMYLELQKKYHMFISYFMAWLILQKEKIKEKGEVKINLKDMKVTEIQRITLNDIKCNYDLEFLKRKFPDAYVLEDSEIQEKLSEISSFNPQRFFRGKYEIEFLEKFISLILENLGSRDEGKRMFGERKKITFHLYNSLQQFSSYADTPECLVDYIERIWNNQDQKIVS